MKLNIKKVVKLLDQLKHGSYIHSSPSFGCSRWLIEAYDLEVVHSKLITWGPLERWGVTWYDKLPYERVEITGADMMIELEATQNCLNYYSDIKGLKMGTKRDQYHYTLYWCGDVGILDDVFVYHDLILGACR